VATKVPPPDWWEGDGTVLEESPRKYRGRLYVGLTPKGNADFLQVGATSADECWDKLKYLKRQVRRDGVAAVRAAKVRAKNAPRSTRATAAATSSKSQTRQTLDASGQRQWRLGEWLDVWIEERNNRRQIVRNTYDQYERMIRLQIKPSTIGDAYLKDLYPDDLIRAVDEWRRMPKRQPPHGVIAEHNVCPDCGHQQLTDHPWDYLTDPVARGSESPTPKKRTKRDPGQPPQRPGPKPRPRVAGCPACHSTATPRVEVELLGDASVKQCFRIVQKAITDAWGDRRTNAQLPLGNLFRGIPYPDVAPELSTDSKQGPKPKERAARTLGIEEARSLLRAALESERPARWLMALTCGTRKGETLGLGWDQIDFDSHTVLISQQLQEHPYTHGCTEDDRCAKYLAPCTHPSCEGQECCRMSGHECEQKDKRGGGPAILPTPKNRRDRELPLVPFLEDALRQHKFEQEQRRLAAGDVWTTRPDFENLVFTDDKGNPIGFTADDNQWEALLDAANVPDARIHDLRHTAASVLLALGYRETLIQDLLGHQGSAITKNYLHIMAEQLREASINLAEFLTGDGPLVGYRPDPARPATTPRKRVSAARSTMPTKGATARP
jgi:integrase